MRLVSVALALIGSLAGCGGDSDEPMVQPYLMDIERQQAFERELTTATERIDYTRIDPDEIVQGRALAKSVHDGRYFRRFIIDGEEHTPQTHEALQPGKRAGHSVAIPYYHDPQRRFSVVRHIFKVEDRWEVISEFWILLPADPDQRRLLERTIEFGEEGLVGDMLENSAASRGVWRRGFPPRGFKTRVDLAHNASGKSRTSGRSKRSSAKAAGSTGDTGSGLSIVNRPGMTARTVKDKNGTSVTIWGQSRSPSRTRGHDATMKAEAERMARSGDYEYVTIQRSWRTATGRVGKSRKIPDVIGVRRDGKVDAVEVRSKTDKSHVLRQRLKKGMRTLPPARRGDIKIIYP